MTDKAEASPILTENACRAEAARCISCGSCLQTCPVYAVVQSEHLVARGRNNSMGSLLKQAAEGTFPEGLDICLLCGRCRMACPRGVQSDRLVAYLRGLHARRAGVPAVKKFVFRSVLANRIRMGRLLRQAGMEVVFPKAQGCCGLAVHANGDTETAAALARHNLEILEACGADMVVTGCATCGSAMRELWPTLGANAEEIARLHALAAKVRDVSEAVFACGHTDIFPLRPSGRQRRHLARTLPSGAASESVARTGQPAAPRLPGKLP